MQREALMLMPRNVSVTLTRVQFFLDWDGTAHKIVVPRTILEDLVGAKLETDQAVEETFYGFRFRIAHGATGALESGRRGDSNGAVMLGLADFPEA